MKTKKRRKPRTTVRYLRIPVDEITQGALEQITTSPGRILDTPATLMLSILLSETVLAVAECYRPGIVNPWPSRVEIAWGRKRRHDEMSQHYEAAERLLAAVDIPG